MGIIYQTISAESKYMLESHEDYDASKNDPLAAYNILESTHKHKLAYVSKSLKPSVIKQELFKCRQFNTETIVDFKDRFVDLCEQYDNTVGEGRKIPQEESTMDFILKLDKRYSTFQNEIKRYADANEEEKIPKTINEAVAKANLMVNEMGVFKNTGFKSSYPAIFSAKTHKGKSKGKKSGKYNEEDEEADKQIKGNCFKCGKKGHRKVDCPENSKKDKKEIKLLQREQRQKKSMKTTKST